MREIKFRGMDLQGRWFYGNLAIIPKDTTNHKAGHCISNSAGMPFAYRVRPETVGQYTGLKDKNGNEIYEGDLIQDNLGYGAVEYRETRAGFRLNYVDGLAKWFLDYTDDEFKTIEVVGNIHETAVMDS